MTNAQGITAIVCLMLLAAFAIFCRVDGAKEIVIGVTGGIIGWMSHSGKSP